MLQFSANLSLLFTEVPLAERFERARKCGFAAVEIQFPYELPATQIQDLLAEHELELVLFNVDADTLLQGGEGLAAVPERQAAFQQAVEQAARYAEMLRPRVINVLPGRCADPSRIADYLATLEANIRHAADVLAPLGVTTVFEAVNSIDMPGFIIDDHDKMLRLLADIAHRSVRLQYDIYHMTRMGEDCAGFLRTHLDKIGHVQFADCPGRRQPGSGQVDFETLFALLEASDYVGWVGAEYRPQGATEASLDWLSRYRTAV